LLKLRISNAQAVAAQVWLMQLEELRNHGRSMAG
jgi:hypothetical protein